MPVVLVVIYSALIGAAVGSFAGAAWYRIPRRISLNGRSHCPSCGRQLEWSDNIPVISWLVFKGKSRCCNKPISVHYLLFEIASCLAGALVGYFFGLLIAFAVAILIIILILIVSIIRRK